MRINNINNIILPKTTKPHSFKSNKEEETKVIQYKLPPYIPIAGLYTPSITTARLQPKMNDFCDFLDEINLGKKSLLSQIKDFSFAFNPKFDVDGWKNFLTEMNNSIAIIEEDEEKEKAITFLQQLSTIHYIPNLINNPKFKPNKAIEFLDELYNKPDEEISKIPFVAQLDFMVDASLSNKETKEYISDLFYFIDFEDINGDKILSERYGEMDRMQVDVIKHMLNVDTSSVEASNTQMLIELVQMEL